MLKPWTAAARLIFPVPSWASERSWRFGGLLSSLRDSFFALKRQFLSILRYANLRVCLPEVPGDLQLSFEAAEPGPATGLSQMRQQEDEQTD
jgi:hypothetical protein